MWWEWYVGMYIDVYILACEWVSLACVYVLASLHPDIEAYTPIPRKIIS